MMKKIFKWLGLGLLLVVTIILVYSIKAYVSTKNRMTEKYSISLQPFTLTSDSAILADGERYTQSCKECHGPDLGGNVWLDDPLLARIVAPNLTKGKGGRPEGWTTEDWLRALKHGLRKDLTPLVVMPSHEITMHTEQDINAMIAFCSQLPPVDRHLPEIKIGLLGYMLTDLGKIDLLPAEKIDHNRVLTKSIKREVSVAFGKYLSVGCEGCHRKSMKGGDPVAPGFPKVADITSTGHLGGWTEVQFINTLRTGITPEGKHLKPSEMPWVSFKSYTDVELKALFKYLSTL